MNLSRVAPVVGLLGALILVASPRAGAQSAAQADGTPVSLTYLQMSSSALSAPGWTFGAHAGGTIASLSTPAPDSGSSAFGLEGSYPVATGGQYIWADYSVTSLNTEDLYIEFWAKMPAGTEGCKFLKVFGQRLTSTSYADFTVLADYTGADPGAIMGAYFGDGTAITNDSQNVIRLNGTDPSEIGRSYGTAVVQTPQNADFPSTAWGTSWHHFRVHIKFNSGTSSANETPNGEIYLEIDGKVYVNATGLYNRNPANGPIGYVEFFGWAQNDASPFQVWYDDIRISTGGFLSTPLPDPPGGVTVD